MLYNVNKGENTFEESEILEPIHSCLRELLELEHIGKGYKARFTDHDIIAITLLYSIITGNRLVHRLVEEKVGITLSNELANHFGNIITQVTKGMTNVDMIEYYKKKG